LLLLPKKNSKSIGAGGHLRPRWYQFHLLDLLHHRSPKRPMASRSIQQMAMLGRLSINKTSEDVLKTQWKSWHYRCPGSLIFWIYPKIHSDYLSTDGHQSPGSINGICKPISNLESPKRLKKWTELFNTRSSVSR
jgi:hypothetical protein